MTKEEAVVIATDAIMNTTSAGPNEPLDETKLDQITDAAANALHTINPTKEYPPVKL